MRQKMQRLGGAPFVSGLLTDGQGLGAPRRHFPIVALAVCENPGTVQCGAPKRWRRLWASTKNPLEPPAPLGEVLVELPEPPQRDGQPQSILRGILTSH